MIEKFFHEDTIKMNSLVQIIRGGHIEASKNYQTVHLMTLLF